MQARREPGRVREHWREANPVMDPTQFGNINFAAYNEEVNVTYRETLNLTSSRMSGSATAREEINDGWSGPSQPKHAIKQLDSCRST